MMAEKQILPPSDELLAHLMQFARKAEPDSRGKAFIPRCVDSISELTPEEVAAALGGYVAKDGGIRAPRPGRSADDDGLSIKLDPSAPDGYLVHSFSGDDPIECRDHVRDLLGLPEWTPPKADAQQEFSDTSRAGKKVESKVVAEYVYRHEDGTPFLNVLRYGPKKSFRQAHWNGKSWAWGKPQADPIPYRLPELSASALFDDPVFIVEGEKDCDRLAKIDLVATTSPEGAGKWKSALNRWFGDRAVYVIADNDRPGRDHAAEVARNLHGTAAEVKVISLPGLPEKGDVSDWLDAGGTRSGLLEIANAAPLWSPGEATEGGGEGEIVLVRADTIEQRPVEWIWQDRIARGKMMLLGGDPGVGKSQTILNVIATITTGGAWPDGGKAPLGNCIILSSEDAANDTICPRLEAAGADMSRVHILRAVREGGRERSFSLETDLANLEAQARRVGDIKLCMIDPVTAYMGKIDSHRTADVRSVLEHVEKFADRTGAAVAAITHPPKASQAKAINSFTGSLAFVASARLAFVAVEEPDTGRSLLLAVKNNIGRKAAGIGYRIQEVTTARGIGVTKIVWDSAPVTLTANEAINQSSGKDGGSGAIDKAKAFLLDRLEFGPLSVNFLYEEAEKAFISQTTLRRAAKDLGIIPKKEGFKGGWIWELPPQSE